MKKIEQVIEFKQIDKVIQIIGAVITVGLAPFTFFMSFFILGFIHLTSTIIWAFVVPKAGVISGRKIIQWINIIVFIVWSSSWFINPQSFEQLVMVMIFAGPVLGVSYFIVTLQEIRFYKKLQQNEQA